MQTSAQYKEDWVLAQYFHKRGGVYVDVGAHDGIQFSNTHQLGTSLGWTGVCVEPNPNSFRRLRKNRPEAFCHQVAITNKAPGTTTLFVPNNVAVLGSTSPDRAGIGRILGIQPATVKCQPHKVRSEPLSEVLRRSGFGVGERFELLAIDTEWTELDVLKSTRLDKYCPEVIVVEANDSTYAEEIKDYLDDWSYHLCGFVGGINYFFVAEQANVEKMGKAISHVASGNRPNL